MTEKKERLFDPGERDRWDGSRELVPVERETCPLCAAPLTDELMGERTLFRHGGHGAERVTCSVHCTECSWSLVHEVQERRP